MLREKGNFSTVSVQWEVFERNNMMPLEDFEAVTGFVVFQDGQTEAYIDLTLIADGIPELVEDFEVRLVDAVVLGENSGKPTIDLKAFNASLIIQENDDPYGLFGFSSDSQSVEVAEDVSTDNSFSDVAVLNITRKKGTFGTAMVRI